jgi:hypothetical protein
MATLRYLYSMPEITRAKAGTKPKEKLRLMSSLSKTCDGLSEWRKTNYKKDHLTHSLLLLYYLPRQLVYNRLPLSRISTMPLLKDSCRAHWVLSLDSQPSLIERVH